MFTSHPDLPNSDSERQLSCRMDRLSNHRIDDQRIIRPIQFLFTIAFPRVGFAFTCTAERDESRDGRWREEEEEEEEQGRREKEFIFSFFFFSPPVKREREIVLAIESTSFSTESRTFSMTQAMKWNPSRFLLIFYTFFFVHNTRALDAMVYIIYIYIYCIHMCFEKLLQMCEK